MQSSLFCYLFMTWYLFSKILFFEMSHLFTNIHNFNFVSRKNVGGIGCPQKEQIFLTKYHDQLSIVSYLGQGGHVVYVRQVLSSVMLHGPRSKCSSHTTVRITAVLMPDSTRRVCGCGYRARSTTNFEVTNKTIWITVNSPPCQPPQ